MNREDITSIALDSVDNYKCTILQLSTGVGKSKIAIEMANKICDKVYKNEQDTTTILLLVAKKVHKLTWENEIKKWGGIKTDSIVMECYESLHKYKNSTFDIVICDESQHLSEKRREVLNSIHISYNLLCLSATLPKNIYYWLETNYNIKNISCKIQNAIDNNILPEPVIYKIPLKLDTTVKHCIYKNTGKGYPVINCNWAERWMYLKKKNLEVHIFCSALQYIIYLNNEIKFYKKKAKKFPWAKNKLMRLSSQRLQFLAEEKNNFILDLLNKFKNYRTLTFCNNINQSEVLGKNCIHSKNNNSDKILNDFNSKKIKHITAVHILNEGVNLTDCRIGIFANINASEIIVTQRNGRLLRHKKPIIIIPYYVNTREEELINKHLEGYNSELIKIITNIEDIIL